MFEHLTGLMSISGSRRCTRKATPILPHAINHAAVAECKSERGLTGPCPFIAQPAPIKVQPVSKKCSWSADLDARQDVWRALDT